MLSYAAALAYQGTMHLRHTGLEKSCRPIREKKNRYWSQKVGLIPFRSLSKKDFARNENSPNPQRQQCTFIIFVVVAVPKGCVNPNEFQNVKDLHFNLVTSLSKAMKSPAPTPALNHIKHRAIFCKAQQQCQCGSASPSLCLLLFVGLFAS